MIHSFHKEATFAKQGGKCAICNTSLGCGFEMYHMSPLCTGVTNGPMIFALYAANATQGRPTSFSWQVWASFFDNSKNHTIESHMSAQLREQFHCLPKPNEVARGETVGEAQGQLVESGKVLDEDAACRRLIYQTPEVARESLGSTCRRASDANIYRVCARTKRMPGMFVVSSAEVWQPTAALFSSTPGAGGTLPR